MKFFTLASLFLFAVQDASAAARRRGNRNNKNTNVSKPVAETAGTTEVVDQKLSMPSDEDTKITNPTAEVIDENITTNPTDSDDEFINALQDEVFTMVQDQTTKFLELQKNFDSVVAEKEKLQGEVTTLKSHLDAATRARNKSKRDYEKTMTKLTQLRSNQLALDTQNHHFKTELAQARADVLGLKKLNTKSKWQQGDLAQLRKHLSDYLGLKSDASIGQIIKTDSTTKVRMVSLISNLFCALERSIQVNHAMRNHHIEQQS